MVAIADNCLGVGLYTPAEAAAYLRVNTQTVNRWMFGSTTGLRVLMPQLGDKDDRVITFLDFAQMMAVRVMRVDYKLPLDKIRQAVDVARDVYGLKYPLATKHVTYLFGEDIVIKPTEDEMIQASGKGRHQRMLKLVELFLRDMAWHPDGLPAKYTAWPNTFYPVVMNPRVRFGEPLLESCGYTAQALWEAARTEGGIEQAAEAYGVKVDEVEVACRYLDHIHKTAA